MPNFVPPVAVFDLDGTLADTAPDLVRTLNVVLSGEGLSPMPIEDARNTIGSGAKALIARGFETDGRELLPDRLDELYQLFLAHYGQNICIETTLYPGVKEALERLQAAGFRLAVCTSKFEAHSVDLLRRLGVAHHFGAIAGRDTFAYIKPDPRHLTLTVERAGSRPCRAVMVGDSRTDIVTAKAAGVPVIAVSFGYTDRPVKELGPDRVIHHFDRLFHAVGELIRLPNAA
jgi:phosphoglycolate phosphatase